LIQWKGDRKPEEENNGVHTRMKIHAQPGRPPIPSMFWIAAAKRPEKTPESWWDNISVEPSVFQEANIPKQKRRTMRC